MWNRPDGKQYIAGALARVWRTAASWACDRIADHEDFLADGEKMFDNMLDELTIPQQLYLLQHVSKAMLSTRYPRPLPTAYEETLVHWVLAEVITLVDAGDADTRPRSLVRDIRTVVRQELDDDEPVDFSDNDEIEEALDRITDLVLHDRDFQDSGYLDMSPEKRQSIGAMMGVHPDYFTQLPPPTNRTVEQARVDVGRYLDRVRLIKAYPKSRRKKNGG